MNIIVFFLQENLSSTFASWMQAAIGLASLILAFFVAFQTKRIKELVSIVKELEKQTVALNKTFMMEKMLTLKDRMPFFVYDTHIVMSQIKVSIRFTNIGCDAFEPRIENISRSGVKISMQDGNTVKQKYYFTIEIEFTDGKISPFEFTLLFRSHFAYESSQQISFETFNKVKAYPPTDVQFFN